MAKRIYGPNHPNHVDDEDARLESELEEDSLDVAEAADRRNGRIRGDNKNSDKQQKDDKETTDEANEEKQGASLGHKVAFAGAVGILGATAVTTAVAVGTKKYEERVRDDISNVVGELVMGNASPMERRMPAIGSVKPSRKEQDKGYEFDV